LAKRAGDSVGTGAEQRAGVGTAEPAKTHAALALADADTFLWGMPLYDQLRADVIVAMKARDANATTALRTADAAIKRAAMDANKEIDDALVIGTLRKAIKNLADANTEFEKGGRGDLVAANQAEIKLLEKYLPAGLDAAKLDALIAEAIQATGAQSKKDMGKVIGALTQRPEAPSIDFSIVSKLVQAKLP
jgi:uncharacterized protein